MLSKNIMAKMGLEMTYLKKLLTDAGYDLHEEHNGWIIATSSYYGHKAAVKIGELPVLTLPEKVAMQLNLHEDGHFVPLTNSPVGYPMGVALEIDELLKWLKKSVKLPYEMPEGVTTTDIEALRKERRGQDKLRDQLEKYWDSRCAVTNVNTEEFLIASHIKPWSECESSAEKLDPYNALLLNVALDKAFDKGYITFNDNGFIILSKQWSAEEAEIMGISGNMKLRQVDHRHKRYLQYHRTNIWRS